MRADLATCSVGARQRAAIGAAGASPRLANMSLFFGAVGIAPHVAFGCDVSAEASGALCAASITIGESGARRVWSEREFPAV